MRIAVTGAGGFVGGAVVRRLLARGHSVLALGRTASGPVDTEYVRWDLGTDGPSPVALRGCDAVVHAAAHVAEWGDRAVFEAVAVAGTGRLLDAVGQTCRLVVIGSSSVYVPDGRRGPYAEPDGPVDDRRYAGPYPLAKARQERIVATRRPDAVILRPRAVWGPGDRTLLPRVEARIRRGWLVLPDGGRHPMSTTHIESLLDAVEASIARADVRGPVNVADATPRTPAELLTALFRARRRSFRIVGVPSWIAEAVAAAIEGAYSTLSPRRHPPLTRYAIQALSAPVILELHRLHKELEVVPDVDLARRAVELADQTAART